MAPWKAVSPTLRIRIFTEGPLAAFGHDRIFDQPVSVTVSAGDNLDGASVQAQGDLRQTALLGESSPSDRADILRRKDRDVLQTDAYPDLRFEGIYRKDSALVAGSLTLHGTTRPVELPITISQAGEEFAIEGSVELDLGSFGVRPYKAFLGGLRVKSAVAVSYSLELHKSR